MSILIKGMTMPKNCDVCPLIAEAEDYHVCYINEQFIPWEWVDEHSAEQRHPKPSWCPLVEIPPHGRLIDADALNYTMLYKENWIIGAGVEALAVWKKDIDASPTIIEAEEGE